MHARRRGIKTLNVTWSERIGGIRRFVVTVLVLATILYVAAFFIVRTDGFRYVVEERMRDAWDWPVRVERVWLNPDWSLVVEGIESEGFETREGAGVAVDEIRLDWSIFRLLHPRRAALHRVRLHGGIFSFQMASDETWQPAFFHADAAALTEWFGLRAGDPPETETRFVAGQVDLHITDAHVYWWNEKNDLAASLSGLTFESDQARILDDYFRYIRMTANEIFSIGHARSHVTHRWLWVNDIMIRLD